MEVHQCSIWIPDDDTLHEIGAIDAIGLPSELSGAAPKRRLHYLAGRLCARRALLALEPERQIASLPRGHAGAPRWPDGVTGSITHTEGFASAAVASTCDAVAVGIDSERVMSARRAAEVSRLVACPFELARVWEAGFDWPLTLTLVFSAKETVFKCLHAGVGHVFEFQDVQIVDVDSRTRTFHARLARTLSATLPVDTVLEGRFDIDLPLIHTGMVISAATS